MLKTLKKSFGIAVISIAAGSLAFAQNAEAATKDTSTDIGSVKLTLEQALEYATTNNRTLKSADIDLEIKERASKYSWNVFLPKVQVAGTMSRATEYSPSSAAMAQLGATISTLLGAPASEVKTDFEKEEDRWSTVGSVSVGWTFSAAYIGQIKSAKAAFETGKISYEQSQKSTLLNIKKLFYGLLIQQENLKIQKATLENARQRMVQAETSYKNGAIPELSLLQTQVNYQNTKPEVESAEQTLMQNLDMFAFLLGMPVGTRIELDGTIEPKYIDANVKNLIENYGDNDLNIKSLKSNIESVKIGVSALNLSVWTPALSVNYAWQPAYIGDEGAFHFWGDIGKDDKWYDSGSLSLTLAWNLTNMLPWSSTQQQIKDYNQQLRQLEISLETLKENQKVEVRKAVDTLNLAKSQIEAMGRNVTLAQRAYDSTYRQYRNGQTELLNLRDAENSLNQAKLGLLNQKYQYVSALLDLENTLNTTLSD
ncbi:MAG: TolC family protein [Treponema sp.]|nr:TolC family protein [Treponema sp.]MBR6912337.1 TolC family protein [Treponema sp.]